MNAIPTSTGAPEPREDRELRKRKLFLGGGLIGLCGVAWVVALSGFPGTTEQLFTGPFVVSLTQGQDQDLVLPLADAEPRQFATAALRAECVSYSLPYAQARAADPSFQRSSLEALAGCVRRRSAQDLADLAGTAALALDMRDALGALLFPIHVGDESWHGVPDPESGLAPGLSTSLATMRGGFESHRLHVDGPARTVRLDEGPLVRFEGTETDLLVADESNQCVYLDVTLYARDFAGVVPVGTCGKLKRVLFDPFILR